MAFLQRLDISENQLTGSIPPSLLLNLTSLMHVSFSDNQLEGTTLISSMFDQNVQLKSVGLSNCNLIASTAKLIKFLHHQTDLRSIDLSHNNIHGKFPNWFVANNSLLKILVLNNHSLSGDTHFSLRTTLVWIDISNNHIEGHLHANFGHTLRGVKYLNLSQNHLEGSIPTSLSNMNVLRVLDLSNINFTGEIPESLALLESLSTLILPNNRLHGQISPILFNYIDLRTLRGSNNKFTGVLPNNNSNGNIRSFHTLDISKNTLSGRIPSWIANMTMLAVLVMRDNSFDGPIPLELCNFDRLLFLDLSQNELSGFIPSCLDLASLRYLHLQGNKLSGSIPRAILQSPYLLTLILKHNSFSGSIPSWLGLLQNLGVLLLNGNHLSGFVPYELCKLNKIRILDLSHNGFSGKIPLCFSNMAFGKSGADAAELAEMSIYDNDTDLFGKEYYQSYISGSLVSQEEVEFMTKSLSSLYKGDILKYMAGMDLSSNGFTGEIPQEFGALIAIRALNLSHNQFIGSIPTTFSRLKQLESMDLSHNKLSGEILSELIAINTLAIFSVSYNNLSGRLPDMKAQFSTFSETSYEGNPYLCGPPLPKQCNTAALAGSETFTAAGLSEKLGVDLISFLASSVAAYMMSLLALVIVLYINPYWRRLWFDSVDACLSFVFPFWSEAIYRVSNPST